MPQLWCAVALLLSAFVAPPRPYRFRISINAPYLSAESQRVVTALLRGLFLDSLIVPATDSQKAFSPHYPSDSAWRRFAKALTKHR